MFSSVAVRMACPDSFHDTSDSQNAAMQRPRTSSIEWYRENMEEDIRDRNSL